MVGSKIYSCVEMFDEDSRRKYLRRKGCWVLRSILIFSEMVDKENAERNQMQSKGIQRMKCEVLSQGSVKPHSCMFVSHSHTVYAFMIYVCLQGCDSSSSHPAASAGSDLAVWSAGPSVCSSCLYLHRSQCLPGKQRICNTG